MLEQLQAMLKDEKEDEEKEILLRKVFDLYVNRPLVGNAPIRKVVFRTPNESIPILSKILSEVDWAVCELLLKGTTLSRIRRMLSRVSKSSVNILSRSLIVLNLYFDDRLLGQHLLVGLIAKDMQQWGGVPSGLTDGTFGSYVEADIRHFKNFRFESQSSMRLHGSSNVKGMVKLAK